MDKVGDMKKLVVLYRSASKRLLNFTRDLEEDKPNDKALSDILHYVLFFIDQLKCEEKAAYVVLGKLKER